MNATIFILPVPFVSDKALRPRKAQMVNFVFALMGNTTEVVALSWNPEISKKNSKKEKEPHKTAFSTSDRNCCLGLYSSVALAQLIFANDNLHSY